MFSLNVCIKTMYHFMAIMFFNGFVLFVFLFLNSALKIINFAKITHIRFSLQINFFNLIVCMYKLCVGIFVYVYVYL